MYANNKNYINPEDYHKFIKNELIELKDLSTKLSPEQQTKLCKFYFKSIILYSCISLSNFIALVLIQ